MMIEQIFLQPLCISLAIIGSGLIVIELRSKFDKSFLLFGIFLILLSAFCAPDLWKKAENTGRRWIEFQHIIVCFICPVIFQYLHHLCKRKIPAQFPMFYFVATIVTILFISGLLIKEENGIAKPAVAYFFTFFPFFITTVILIFYVLTKQMISASPQNSSVLRLHFFGFILLIVCGCLDLVQLSISRQLLRDISSYTIFGTIGVGMMLTFLFSERLVILIRERLVYINKLQEAYKELERAKDLSELGKSTAIINHEIKNYMMVISGYSILVRDKAGLDEKYRAMLSTITETVVKLSAFSNEILNFSKAKIVSDLRPLAISQLVKTCARMNFPQKRRFFCFENESESLSIYGDWKKLEHVFVNLFKNAIEAGAERVSIKYIPSDYVMLICIEDDGCGVIEKDLPNLFKAFYTTKSQGTGLGMATSRSIVESHGGHISVMSKNCFTDGIEHGLIIHISFPKYSDKRDASQKDNIVLIEQDLPQLQAVIQVLRNVYAQPHVIQSTEDIKGFKVPESTRIIGGPAAIAKIVDSGYQCYSLVTGQNNVLRAIGNPPDRKERVFNEEFVVTMLMKH